MMNSYKINFNKIRENNLSVFEALERAMKNIDVDFYLIGAQSRNVWIDHLGLKGIRTTLDIDYLVYVKDRATWYDLIKYLEDKENLIRDKELPYRYGNIDIIPFGGIEVNGEITLDNPTTELSVFGCKEVSELASVIEGNFKIITLPGFCILKLIAYSEKPNHRLKDYEDYLFLVNNYHEIAGEELFSSECNDLIDEDLDLKIASARMLGRHLRPILKSNKLLQNKILEVLIKKISTFNFDEINEMYKLNKENQKVLEFKLIAETIKGIQD